jgi:hypothetical protein
LDEWIIPGNRVTVGEPYRVVSDKTSDNLTAFEVIAIAEKYAKGDTPESVTKAVALEEGIYDN